MGNLVFQATLGGQVNLVGPNTASTFNLNVPAVAGTLVTTGDTGTVTNTMCATSVYTTPGTIGSGTPNTGAFTTLSASSTTTLSGGTANGVAYLNGSKVVTTGSALVFDGTNLGIGTSSPTYKLQVSNTSAYAQMALQGSSANGGILRFYDSAAVVTASIFGFGSASGSDSYALRFDTNGSERMRLDSSGNLGLGVTPSAWSGFTASQIKNGSVATSGNDVFLNANCFYNGTNWRYIASSFASQFYEDSGAFIWRTAASGTAGNAITFTQAMTLDASGNLGVGTTSPTTKIHVYTGSATGTYARMENTAGILYTGVKSGGEGYLATESNTALTFATNGTERARIDSSGNFRVGVGTSTTNIYMDVNHATGSTNGSSFFVSRYNGTQIGDIAQATTSTVAYNTSSDYRLKENIQPMTGALEKVALLKPCTYTWKIDGAAGQGFIAHELQEVVPDCVTGAKDAVETYTDEEGNEQTRIKPQGVDTSFLVATLTAAIQEQQAIINTLIARIEALENK